MSLIKEGHMSQFKAGKMKDKEQFVNCKLISYGVGERPEIQVFTDGSSKKPYSVLKVKSFAAVCESDQVPKIVKAKYDNYICITASGTGGKPTYLRTDTREQRDEWCRELQALINLKVESQQVAPQQPLQPHRERTRTDATSNRPPISRGRKGNTLNTAPGTMVGTFHDELNKVVKKRNNLAEVTEEVSDCQICCDRHHLEHGLPHDAHCQATYQNVHHVANVDEWRRQQQSSKQALKETQELYNDFHQTSMIQVQHDEPENEYETPEFRRDPLPDSSYRLSGCSTSSEESASGSQAMSLPHSLHSCKEPVESSWPPSPVLSAEDSEPEYPEGNPPTSLTRTLPELSRLREPEASLCVQEEQVYENTSLFQRRPRTGSKPPPLPRSASLRTESTPKLPPRKSSLPTSHQPVPPKLPEKNPAMKIEAQSRKLKDEKLAGTAIVRMSKTTLVRNLSCLSLKKTNDCIIITKVPCELKDYFRVGDQWLKVNDAFLNGVQFAHDCVQMSDKLEIEITLKRIPFGTICEFPWTSNNVDDIGLTLTGNEIERVHPEGLAHCRGSLQSNDTTCMRSAGMRCNYVITEVNFQCVCPDASTEEVQQMIKNAGRNIVLILHPIDFRTLQRGYDIDEDDCEYENVG